jgi:antitoxin (DNA-binding transcriptional repressor) of toxin-antitoxin stability system
MTTTTKSSRPELTAKFKRVRRTKVVARASQGATVAKTVVITVTASKAREQFSTWVNMVGHGNKWIVLKRHGKATVAMVPIADLETLRELEDKLDLQAARDAMSEPGEVPWEEVKAKLGL